MERQAAVRPGANQNIYNQVSLNLSEVSDPGQFFLWPEGRHPFRVVTVEEAVGKPKDDGFGGTKPGTPYILIGLECTEGPCEGMGIEDRLMREGKGLSRLKMFIKAVGLLNEDTGTFTGCWADFLNKRVWATIETEENQYQGKTNQRSKVAFAGYEAAEAWGVPKEDEFDETLPVVEAPTKKGGDTPPWKQ